MDIFSTYDTDGWMFTSGTGKFAGITGKGSSKATIARTAAIEDRNLSPTTKGEWEIK